MAKKDRANMINRQTGKQWYTKTQDWPTRTPLKNDWSKMLRKGNQILFQMWHLSCCFYGKDLFNKWDDVFNFYQSRLCTLEHPENSLRIRFIMNLNLNRISKQRMSKIIQRLKSLGINLLYINMFDGIIIADGKQANKKTPGLYFDLT